MAATLIVPEVKPEDFVLIPETGSYVCISKARGYQGGVITNLTGYDEIRMAQKLGLYPTSSAERDKSRKYFQDNPEKDFGGQTGREIAESYITGEVERTATFISYRGADGEFPRDTHDLLKKLGFDGKIALIDFPYVQEDEDILIPNSRLRLVDISANPPKAGHGQEYDWDLGFFTKVTPKPNYNNAYQWLMPNGTRQLLRGHWDWWPIVGRRLDIGAAWVPEVSHSSGTSRLSSVINPSELLTLKPDERVARTG